MCCLSIRQMCWRIPPQRFSPLCIPSPARRYTARWRRVLGEIVTDQEQEAPMPLDKLCIVFIFFALQCGGILRPESRTHISSK